jgi:hypothetical protein
MTGDESNPRYSPSPLLRSLTGGIASAFIYFLAVALVFLQIRLLPGALGWLGLFMSGPGLLAVSLLNPGTDQAIAYSVIYGVSVLFYFLEGFLLARYVERFWLRILLWVVIAVLATLLGYGLSIAALAGSSP